MQTPTLIRYLRTVLFATLVNFSFTVSPATARDAQNGLRKRITLK